MSKKNSAVSPVIGTILLVAITVALVAIIGAVVMSLADAEEGRKVGMSAMPSTGGSNVTLLLYGGDSIPDLVKLEMIDQGSSNAQYKEIWNKSVSGGEPLVGHPYSVSEVAAPLESVNVYETTINVKGTFMDGTEKILLVQPMTFYDVKIPSVIPPFVGSVWVKKDDNLRTTWTFREDGTARQGGIYPITETVVWEKTGENTYLLTIKTGTTIKGCKAIIIVSPDGKTLEMTQVPGSGSTGYGRIQGTFTIK